MESQLLQMSQTKTGQDSASTDQLIREWLFRFGLNFGKDVVPLLPLWQEQLGGIEPAVLQHIFQNAICTCKFFPTIAELRGQIEKADSAGLELEASEAWDRYLAHVQKYFQPDLGWDRCAPRLDAISEHAGRTSGRAHWIEGCPESELQWARKKFIESYTLAHETGQVQNLLTRGEAKKILASLTAPSKQITTQAQSSPKPDAPFETPRESFSQTLDSAQRQLGLNAQESKPTVEEGRSKAFVLLSTPKSKIEQLEALARYLESHPGIQQQKNAGGVQR